jgi:Transglycosylase SLT domain
MNITSTVAYGPEITAAATRHHLDPRLLAAVAAQETGGPGSDSGRNVIGDGGHGRGLFQIDDRWHAFARTPAAMDPAQNADYAAGLLESNLNRYGDVRAALSAYNAGSPNAAGTRTDWGDGKPVGYADSVFRHYARLEAADPRDSAAEIDALRGLAGDVGQGASAGQFCPVGAMPLNLPAYRPLAQPDTTQRDLAPANGDFADATD